MYRGREENCGTKKVIRGCNAKSTRIRPSSRVVRVTESLIKPWRRFCELLKKIPASGQFATGSTGGDLRSSHRLCLRSHCDWSARSSFHTHDQAGSAAVPAIRRSPDQAGSGATVPNDYTTSKHRRNAEPLPPGTGYGLFSATCMLVKKFRNWQ